MATPKNITTENASLKTATVEIKCLSVSGKQMTLAVFRQLPLKKLINSDTLALSGVPWGRVNYCTKECEDVQGVHLHIVWQEGSCLYRDILSSRAPSLTEYLEHKHPAIAQESVKVGAENWSLAYAVLSFSANQLRILQNDDAYPERLTIKPSDANRLASFDGDVQTYQVHLDKWRSLFSALSNLDQLFIAV